MLLFVELLLLLPHPTHRIESMAATTIQQKLLFIRF
jgi:hypothetical protein